MKLEPGAAAARGRVPALKLTERLRPQRVKREELVIDNTGKSATMVEKFRSAVMELVRPADPTAQPPI